MRTKITLWAAVALMAASCGQGETATQDENNENQATESVTPESRSTERSNPVRERVESGATPTVENWAGTYEGVLPCKHCDGTKTIVSISEDMTYKLTISYMGRGGEEYISRGRLKFLPDGNHFFILAENNKEEYSFRISEGKLTLVDNRTGRGPDATATEHVLEKKAN